ncbi:MAG: DUF3991 and TOPRIM domain-containing protein [Planctomycetaceae bacterium]
MQSRSDELEQMKRIDLCQYAASRGFVLDRRQSSRSSAVMKHPNGDKLIVTKSKTGQFIYFNAKGNDSGTIIDFIQTRDRVSLGEVRKLLRPWIGINPNPLLPRDLPASPMELQPSEHDAARVLTTWLEARPIAGSHPYLETERGIPRSLLADPIFADRIRIDRRGNALFPHHNADGLCGFELKNRNFTGFSPGGIKALHSSVPRPDDRIMVICETGIDLLSYAAIKGTDRRRFFSTAGQISPLQSDCLRSAAEQMPPGSIVVLALDNDDGGRKLSAQISEALADIPLAIVPDFPPNPGEDWNDVLRRIARNVATEPASP